jgi:hypothetical protein
MFESVDEPADGTPLTDELGCLILAGRWLLVMTKLD